MGFPGGSVVKNLPVNTGVAGDAGLIPELGGGNGKPLHYSCLDNPMNREAWWTAVHRVAELDTTEQLSMHM